MGDIITLTTINEEPRVLDTDLAEALGMDRPRDIRVNVIEPNRAEREGFGSLLARKANSGSSGGRPSTTFYLNGPPHLPPVPHRAARSVASAPVRLPPTSSHRETVAGGSVATSLSIVRLIAGGRGACLWFDDGCWSFMKVSSPWVKHHGRVETSPTTSYKDYAH